MSKKNQCQCGEALFLMNNKTVCPVCDDFLFDIEIECEEVEQAVEGGATTSTGITKETSLIFH